MTNKEIFKNNLKLIEIETFSYCNRKCWFCPNSFVDRLSDNKIMEEDKYLNLISQLQEIDYSGELTFSRYNEPLSHRDLFLKRVKQARSALPNATLRTNTNGDYVTRDYIEELCDIGFDQLWIQQYLANNERYNHDKMRKRAERKIKKLGLPAKVLTDIEGCKLEYDVSHRDMTIHIRSRNFELDGSSRGDTIQIAEDYTRTQKCTQVSNNMYIDYNGSVMVCCALRSDVPGQESGIMGHIDDGKLWDIYMSDKYKPWREHHEKDGPKEGFCKSCRDSVKPSYEE
ncbi:SPASM domain-containing protein [bacterium]|nr:SPASM domain-containing protein [bacterium]